MTTPKDSKQSEGTSDFSAANLKNCEICGCKLPHGTCLTPFVKAKFASLRQENEALKALKAITNDEGMCGAYVCKDFASKALEGSDKGVGG